MIKGDIILIHFPFTDLSGSKLRPAIVLTQNDRDITVCFITTQFKKRESTDISLQPSVENGIKMASLIKVNKIATLDRILALGKIGSLDATQLAELNSKLIQLFQLL